MTAPDRPAVTLYRVRRPDGTLIDKPPSTEKTIAAAAAWDELPKEMRTKAQLAPVGAIGLRLLWTLSDLGYIVEPVKYVEVKP